VNPTIAKEVGVKQGVWTYGLSKGYAYCLTNGEWKLEKVIDADLRSVEYTYRIIFVHGRACAVFSVLGGDRWAQPINDVVSPSVAKREKAAARRVEVVQAVPPKAVPVGPAPVQGPPPAKRTLRKREPAKPKAGKSKLDSILAGYGKGLKLI
jgi:hypothetical protein